MRTLPKLLQLAIDNKAAPKSFSVKAEGDATRIELYDVIDDYYGVSASDFVTALNGITSGDISLHINSPGGDVFSARAMVAAIAAHPSTITAYVDGLAASAASYVAMACDSVVMQDGSMLMIHNAWSFAMGNAADMRATAVLLEKIDGSIVNDYMRKTGLPADEIKQMMEEETWLDAAEALAKGFADSVATNDKGMKMKSSWNLSAYANAPKPVKASGVCGAACPACGVACCGHSKCPACGADATSACSCEECGTSCCGYASCPDCCAPCCSAGECVPGAPEQDQMNDTNTATRARMLALLTRI
jgi:ATP-dependent Clp protease protease subunit